MVFLLHFPPVSLSKDFCIFFRSSLLHYHPQVLYLSHQHRLYQLNLAHFMPLFVYFLLLSFLIRLLNPSFRSSLLLHYPQSFSYRMLLFPSSMHPYFTHSSLTSYFLSSFIDCLCLSEVRSFSTPSPSSSFISHQASILSSYYLMSLFLYVLSPSPLASFISYKPHHPQAPPSQVVPSFSTSTSCLLHYLYLFI